jgi:hypothetical protein
MKRFLFGIVMIFSFVLAGWAQTSAVSGSNAPLLQNASMNQREAAHHRHHRHHHHHHHAH